MGWIEGKEGRPDGLGIAGFCGGGIQAVWDYEWGELLRHFRVACAGHVMESHLAAGVAHAVPSDSCNSIL